MEDSIQGRETQETANRVKTLRHLQTQELLEEQAHRDRIVFASGRQRAILAVLAHDHGGPCRTDDGEIYLDLLMPYWVELHHLSDRHDFRWAMERVGYWLPKVFADLGRDALAERWNSLSELRSVAVASQDANPTHRGKALYWLPRARQISDALALSRARRDSVNARYPKDPPIRGLPAIDPLSVTEIRESKRVAKEMERRAKGVAPQSSRTKVADREALSQKTGWSVSKIQRMERKGTLESELESHGFGDQKVSPPYTNNMEATEVGHFSMTEEAVAANARHSWFGSLKGYGVKDDDDATRPVRRSPDYQGTYLAEAGGVPVADG